MTSVDYYIGHQANRKLLNSIFPLT